MARRSNHPSGSVSYYWNTSLDTVLDQFNKETDQVNRDAIFEADLKKPMQKLVEYVYNTFQFPYLGLSPQTAQHDALGYLVLHCQGYEPAKGKSFSYCTLIVRNYFIALNNRA